MAMTKQELVNFHNNVWLKYHKHIKIVFENEKDDDFHAFVGSAKVCLPKSVKTNQSEWTLLCFLHEIGHIMTNTCNMKRYEMEFLATQWALDEAKRIGFVVMNKDIQRFQRYINGYARKIRKNPPDLKDLLLKY